jgi:uncharacterized protein (DUF488 family)
MLDIYTIGYEHHTTQTFIERLTRHGITLLVDIREVPISRKKGFSKTGLTQMLSENGIRYVHIKRLGSPSAIRHDLYHNGQHEAFFAEYGRYLAGENDALEELISLSREGKACMMCVEQMPEACHRHIVVEAVKQRLGQEVQVHHI